MNKHTRPLSAFLLIAAFGFASGTAGEKGKPGNSNGEITERAAMLWRQPQDVASENLLYGAGGSEHQPQGPYTFIDEDLEGTNPKFNVRDANGIKWKVKMGDEARPETVASRLVWAMGYNTDWDYFLPKIQVEAMPERLHRGQDNVQPGGAIDNVRLKREPEGQKKVGSWKWRDNPFSGTRELNGLRVLMALVNDWDVKDENNAIRQNKSSGGAEEQVYEVSDLGATFGRAGFSLDRHSSKGELDSYAGSHFIGKEGSDYVDFATPRRPDLIALGNPHEFFSRLGLEWVGKHIPRQDARWMGQLLGQLSHEQIADAFRAGGYSDLEIIQFTVLVEGRIEVLKQL